MTDENKPTRLAHVRKRMENAMRVNISSMVCHQLFSKIRENRHESMSLVKPHLAQQTCTLNSAVVKYALCHYSSLISC